MMEIWKDIENYEDLYQVSNLGNIKSLKRNKILKPAFNKSYLQIGLYKDGKRKFFLIHRLVAEAFLPNEDELPEVDHISGDKTDNRVANLQWITNIENNRKRKTGWGQPRRVQCIETGEIFESINAAAIAMNRTFDAMSKHVRGLTQTCAGKHFEYYDKNVIDSDANTILFGIRQKDLRRVI